MESELEFVWQQNGFFQTAGSELARLKGVPYILQMEAPLVWEAARWGVARPGWGSLLERFGERPDLQRADLVTCVSSEVAQEVESMGFDRSKILITPCSVDLQLFATELDGTRVREAFGVQDRFVVGWVGGFRSFHGLDLLIDAADRLADRLPDLSLFLVGDGILRPKIEDDVKRRGLENVVLTGAVPHGQVPEHIAAMDVAVLSGPVLGGFHYSPLKMREYMACGKPVIAPNVGSIADAAVHGEEALLVTPWDTDQLVRTIEMLYSDESLRQSLGANARRRVELDGTWDTQLDLVLRQLDGKTTLPER